jgi:hypothetical protein
MSVTGVSSATSNAALLKFYRQRNQDLTSLESALQAGDMAAAQQSLTSLQQDTQNIQSALDPSGDSADPRQSGGSSASGHFTADLAALLQAVQSGDMAGARRDATAVQTDLKNAGLQSQGATAAHRHHHQHLSQAANSASTSNDVVATSDPTADTAAATDPIATLLADANSGASASTLSLIQALYMSN